MTLVNASNPVQLFCLHNTTKCFSPQRKFITQTVFRMQLVYTTRCVIITGTLNFQGQNLVNTQFICTKISWPRHEIMLRERREVLPELSIICTAFTL